FQMNIVIILACVACTFHVDALDYTQLKMNVKITVNSTLNSTALDVIFEKDSAELNYSPQVLVDNCAALYELVGSVIEEHKALSENDWRKVDALLENTTNAFENLKPLIPRTVANFKGRIDLISKANAGDTAKEESIAMIKKTLPYLVLNGKRWRANERDGRQMDNVFASYLYNAKEKLSLDSKAIINPIFCLPDTYGRIVTDADDDFRASLKIETDKFKKMLEEKKRKREQQESSNN
ncbi:hypothetical protein PFISCL1PPCAC_17199, partial [Pristionchus fissidentatus]